MYPQVAQILGHESATAWPSRQAVATGPTGQAAWAGQAWAPRGTRAKRRWVHVATCMMLHSRALNPKWLLWPITAHGHQVHLVLPVLAALPLGASSAPLVTLLESPPPPPLPPPIPPPPLFTPPLLFLVHPPSIWARYHSWLALASQRRSLIFSPFLAPSPPPPPLSFSLSLPLSVSLPHPPRRLLCCLHMP